MEISSEYTGEGPTISIFNTDSFLTQHVLEPTRGTINVLDIVLSSQNELVDYVKIYDPLGNSDHNQIHFDIKVKSESKTKKNTGKTFTKVNIKI